MVLTWIADLLHSVQLSFHNWPWIKVFWFRWLPYNSVHEKLRNFKKQGNKLNSHKQKRFRMQESQCLWYWAISPITSGQRLEESRRPQPDSRTTSTGKSPLVKVFAAFRMSQISYFGPSSNHYLTWAIAQCKIGVLWVCATHISTTQTHFDSMFSED